MRFDLKADDIGAVLKGTVSDVERAVTTAMDDVTAGLKAELREQVTGAGLGTRLANTWRGKRYPEGGRSADAAAFVWSKAPFIIDAFERGVTIRSKKGFWLAIPTPAAGATGLDASGARKKITPGGWERRTGMRLRFVYRRGAPSLLVADDARLGKTGVARSRVRKTKAGGSYVPITGRQTIVVFILVPQVTLRKRLDVEGAADRWGDRVAGLIAQHWI
jgi:hypothetical protein